MEWSGYAPAPPAIEAGKGCQRQGARHVSELKHLDSQNSNTSMTAVGIDIGQNSFHVVGLDQCGAAVLRQKWSRG